MDTRFHIINAITNTTHGLSVSIFFVAEILSIVVGNGQVLNHWYGYLALQSIQVMKLKQAVVVVYSIVSLR